ncbi:FadR/GntR family transcriptional regulator [uncultured Aeromicrobium sp.]|uniref:FadR/GntR family transcriptional regulator n=1 Tax=uncultured Aeromicrobium sp. TaxID=337820 RepID=UPI0025F62CBB|nr:FadR/GntR family transcriptional regulator [uncultured Aeromicrobium sp.]
MQVARIERPTHTIGGAVGAHLLQLIATELKPGDRLPPERELAASLGVSRTSVREALAELHQRGLVERRPGRGTTVLAPPEHAGELEERLAAETARHTDAAELRLIVEPQIAALAARRAGESDLLALERTLAESEGELTAEDSLKLDIRFHLQLATASRNPLLEPLCSLTSDWVREVRAYSHRTSTGRQRSLEGHRAIYQAVRARDAEAACEAMVAHLGEVAALGTDVLGDDR